MNRLCLLSESRNILYGLLKNHFTLENSAWVLILRHKVGREGRKIYTHSLQYTDLCDLPNCYAALDVGSAGFFSHYPAIFYI